MQASWCVRTLESSPFTDLLFPSQEKVPSLTRGVKEAGIFLAAFGMRDDAESGTLDLDASMHNGTLVF